MDNQSKMNPSPDEPEAIRQQMEETREHLNEKLGLLEKQVGDTVQGATDAVAAVKQTVTETVQTVQKSVHDTIETVSETFDVRRQVELHPWGMMIGAAAAGFVGGYVLSSGLPAVRLPRRSLFFTRQKSNGNGRLKGYAGPDHGVQSGPTPAGESRLAATSADWMQPVANKLKGLAVAAAMGVVRDMIAAAVPKGMEQPVSDTLNEITSALGGQPIRGPILAEKGSAAAV